MIPQIPPFVAILIGAWISLILTSKEEIIILVKNHEQRTGLEQKKVERGLLRSVLLETCLFVPVTAVLILLVSPLMIGNSLGRALSALPGGQTSYFVILGIVFYGVPFATIRRIVLRIAKTALTDFSNWLNVIKDEMHKED